MPRLILDLPDLPPEAIGEEELVRRYLDAIEPTLREKVHQWMHQPRVRRQVSSQYLFELTFEEFSQLEEAEQRAVRDEALLSYRAWFESELRQHGAEWILMVGGRVERHSSSLNDLPAKSDLEYIGKTTGLVPFLFVREPLIEEVTPASGAPSAWSQISATDFYPTIQMRVGHADIDDQTLLQTGVAMIADLDTGAPVIILNRAEVERTGTDLTDYAEIRGIHLGATYGSVLLQLRIGILTRSGKTKTALFRVRAVDDWSRSPFVAVNPHRAALAGRNLLLNLAPFRRA